MRTEVSRRTKIVALVAAAGASLTLAAFAGPEQQPTQAPAGDQTAMPGPAELAMMMAMAQGGGGEDQEFPSFAEVSQGFRQVVSTTDGMSFYNLWVNDEDGRMLAELPRGFEFTKQFFAMTVAGGEVYAGLQAGDLYCYWKRFDDRLALIAPQISVRSDGDAESRAGVERLFTDRVILDVGIVCMGPSGQPVIDMKELLLSNAPTFFGYSAYGLQSHLATIAKAKAFPENIEVAYEVPGPDGVIKTLHYSISQIANRGFYQPRKADERVGFFTTTWKDLGTFDDDEVWVRYITRWNLEKRDPRLKMSPPKEPIVFYIDAATPVRYRRWVKQGIEYWNKAFEQTGIVGAIEVRYQDAETGAHMEKDPEDVRYNFIRWLANDEGTAIGPSRINPETGQILDADIVLTDGFIRGYVLQNRLLPETAMQTFSPRMVAWLDKNPQWDPRLRLVSPVERDDILRQRREAQARGVLRYGGHPAGNVDPSLLGDDEYDGLAGRVSQMNGLCMLGTGKAVQVAALRMQMEVLQAMREELASMDPEDVDEIPPEVLELIRKQIEENPQLIDQLPPEIRAKLGLAEPQGSGSQPAVTAAAQPDMGESDGQSTEELLDGMPEEYVGPLLADLVAHEVGHTLGLRHNFKASSVHTMAQYNSEEFKGKKPWSASVMDYSGMNFRLENGEVQGDLCPIDIGPYDMWAIEYGYTFDDPAKVAARAADPTIPYGTDEDTWGPDPLCTRWDLGADPFNYAAEMVRIAKWHRERILDKFVKDGQSWSKARRGYQLTLWLQTGQMGNVARWIGGSYVYRDKKGDENGRTPIVPVEPAKQREALGWIVSNIFSDEAYGLTPELLQHMTNDRWWDEGGWAEIFSDPAFPIHERIMGIQASALTMILNPETLQRVFDNESRVAANQDAFTLPELFDGVTSAIWTELSSSASNRYTPRQPMISSLRRNLQREHLNRLIDLSFGAADGSAGMAASNLATMHLRQLHGRIDGVLTNGGGRLDAYSAAHLGEAKIRIEKALEAQYVYNGGAGGGTVIYNFYDKDGQPSPQR